jgi:hypothetical protein
VLHSHSTSVGTKSAAGAADLDPACLSGPGDNG